MDRKDGVKQKWISFWKALISPGPAFLLLSAGALIFLSVIYRDNVPFAVVINIIGSLLVGIGGAFSKKEYEKLIGDSIMEKKGRSAIRNLESINQQIYKIREWISTFIKNNKAQKDDLGEVDRHLSMTEFNIQSAIEDWVDVVPELEIFSKLLRVKETELMVMKQKLGIIEEKLLKNKDNEDMKRKLREQKKLIEKLEGDIKVLKKDRSSLLAGGIVAPFSSPHELYGYSGSPSFTDLNAQIEALLTQIAQLQKELNEAMDSGSKEKKAEE